MHETNFPNGILLENLKNGVNGILTVDNTGIVSVSNTNVNSINNLYSTYTNSSTVAAISAGLDSRLTVNSLVDTQQTNSINTLFSTYANSSTVAAISAGLDSRLTVNSLVDTQQTNSINTLFSTYTNSSTVAAISAGLDSRLTANTLVDTQQTNSINNLYSTYTNSSTTQAISAGLDSRLTANTLVDTQQTNSINNLYSTYTNSSTTQAISAGLNTRVSNVENSYATKATPVAGTYNNVVVNSQGVVTSGGNATYTIPSDLNPYALTSTLVSVSGSLNTLISNEVTNRTNADLLLTPLTTTASISGELNSRLTNVESNYATKATPIAGTYNNVIVNSQGVVTSGGNAIYIVPSDLTPYALSSTLVNVSGSLEVLINNEVTNRTNADLLLTPLTTTSSVSGSLNTNMLNGFDTTLTYNISGSLETLVTVKGTKTFNYDGSGNLVSISATGEYISKAFGYDIDGNLTTITLG